MSEVTPDQRAAILRLRKDGLSIAEIAEAVGLDPSLVRAVFAREER
jgi:DNA-directed RNA polymerase specialized sigma24 family protein